MHLSACLPSAHGWAVSLGDQGKQHTQAHAHTCAQVPASEFFPLKSVLLKLINLIPLRSAVPYYIYLDLLTCFL